MPNSDAISFHLSAEANERLFHWSNECEMLDASAREKIGSLEYEAHVKNANLLLTPSIAVSPVINESLDVFVTCGEKKRIDVWKLRSSKPFTPTYNGYFEIPELDAGNSETEIAVDFSSRRLNEILGDITYFTLYVSCPKSSKIRYIAIPTQQQVDRKRDAFVFGAISHPHLFQPTAMCSWARDSSSLLAVVSKASGNVFIFKKDGWSHTLLQIIEHNRIGLRLPSTSIAWDDDSDRLYVANNKEVNSFKVDNNNNRCKYEMSHNTEDLELTSIHCCRIKSESVLLGTSAKNNRVVALKSNDQETLVSELLGPCTLQHPMRIASIPYLNILVVAERLSTAREPLVSFFSY